MEGILRQNTEPASASWCHVLERGTASPQGARQEHENWTELLPHLPRGREWTRVEHCCDECELHGLCSPHSPAREGAKVGPDSEFYLGSSNPCTARALLQWQHWGRHSWQPGAANSVSFVSHKENLWLKGGVLKYPIKTSALDAAGGGRVAVGGGCWLAPGVQRPLHSTA